MAKSIEIPTIDLPGDVAIPQFGLGVFQVPPEKTVENVTYAIEAGYRHIDTAKAYGNEAQVGQAIRASGLPREDFFVTTKLWNDEHGDAVGALKRSLGRLELDYVDLYLIHWPAGEQGKYIDSWGGLMKNKELGDAKSIGVSNFHEEHLSNVIDLSFFTPAVNQIELHPLLNQAHLREVNKGYGIVTQAYSPLGVGRLLDNETVVSVAQAHGKTPAQVLIKWSLQLGNSVITRSRSPEHLAANLEVFDFELTDDQMAALNGLDDGTRYRPDPETYTG